jgi:YidC/Oxa1 family membrane protein insertase
MEHIVDMSAVWLRPLALLFKWYITMLHKLVRNYGIVILLFSLTLKILLTPLTNKSLRSSKKLQELQPKMKEIQQKFKNDIKKQQEELKALYKEHNVSPLGGCLPLLFQMPIFFALYPVLRYSIEFRQAKFLYLKDLSAPDPYIIIPILMGIFMFIQQRMMQPAQVDTSNMDEQQRAMQQSGKMMTYIMPPFMIFIFKSLPAGLVLYWTTFNVLSIVQQYYLNKKENN